jgi:glycosyltransferase involved in cell wall biosynthesis
MATVRSSTHKIWVLPADENWICDELVNEWISHNADITTTNIENADIVWLLSDWRWKSVPWNRVRKGTKVVTTVHHIVTEKFGPQERDDFKQRDRIVTCYHVYNQRTFDVVSQLTKKPIVLLHYWANQDKWRQTIGKEAAKQKCGLPLDRLIVSSFQRDTEGKDLVSPKLEKGPDLFVDYVVELNKTQPVYVLLGGWRRQYVSKRLRENNILFKIPACKDDNTISSRLATQSELNEMYQATDLYVVSSRCEGGPQALIECGLVGTPVVSRAVGIAEQVLKPEVINDDLTLAVPSVPDVEGWKLPQGMKQYRRFFEEL